MCNDMTGHILQCPEVTDVSKCFPPILSTRMTWVWVQLHPEIVMVYSFFKSDAVQCDGSTLTLQMNRKFHHNLHWWRQNVPLKRQYISTRIFNSNLSSQTDYLGTEFFVFDVITSLVSLVYWGFRGEKVTSQGDAWLGPDAWRHSAIYR
jgi:hypothetical protein